MAPVFENMTLSSQIEIVRRLAGDAPRITLFGSSMGGYVSALLAAGMPQVERIVLLAPAFGLSARWAATLGGDQMETWRSAGQLAFYHYGERQDRLLSYGFVTDAARYPDYPEFQQPALILHGKHDDVVPVDNSIAAANMHPNRELRVYDSGHELTDVLPELWAESKAFLGIF